MNTVAKTFTVFKPMVQVAMRKAQELVSAGGYVVRETEQKVVIRRGVQEATVDAWGRVMWENREGQRAARRHH